MALSDEELESIEAAAAALPEAAATPIRALLAEVERLHDVLRGERSEGDDEPWPRGETVTDTERLRLEQSAHAATRRNLGRANRWIAKLERDLHALGGPKPRIADLVEAQGDGEQPRAPSRPPVLSAERASAYLEAHILGKETGPAPEPPAVDVPPSSSPRIAIVIDGREVHTMSSEVLATRWNDEVERALVARLAAVLAGATPVGEDDPPPLKEHERLDAIPDPRVHQK